MERYQAEDAKAATSEERWQIRADMLTQARVFPEPVSFRYERSVSLDSSLMSDVPGHAEGEAQVVLGVGSSVGQ